MGHRCLEAYAVAAAQLVGQDMAMLVGQLFAAQVYVRGDFHLHGLVLACKAQRVLQAKRVVVGHGVQRQARQR